MFPYSVRVSASKAGVSFQVVNKATDKVVSDFGNNEEEAHRFACAMNDQYSRFLSNKAA